MSKCRLFKVITPGEEVVINDIRYRSLGIGHNDFIRNVLCYFNDDLNNHEATLLRYFGGCVSRYENYTVKNFQLAKLIADYVSNLKDHNVPSIFSQRDSQFYKWYFEEGYEDEARALYGSHLFEASYGYVPPPATTVKRININAVDFEPFMHATVIICKFENSTLTVSNGGLIKSFPI